MTFETCMSIVCIQHRKSSVKANSNVRKLTRDRFANSCGFFARENVPVKDVEG